tara:strand:+ start:12215 stop:12496 length:282 start_codon:yes stop_codon:yes gene_type:complete
MNLTFCDSYNFYNFHHFYNFYNFYNFKKEYIVLTSSKEKESLKDTDPMISHLRRCQDVYVFVRRVDLPGELWMSTERAKPKAKGYVLPEAFDR